MHELCQILRLYICIERVFHGETWMVQRSTVYKNNNKCRDVVPISPIVAAACIEISYRHIWNYEVTERCGSVNCTYFVSEAMCTMHLNSAHQRFIHNFLFCFSNWKKLQCICLSIYLAFFVMILGVSLMGLILPRRVSRNFKYFKGKVSPKIFNFLRSDNFLSIVCKKERNF